MSWCHMCHIIMSGVMKPWNMMVSCLTASCSVTSFFSSCSSLPVTSGEKQSNIKPGRENQTDNISRLFQIIDQILELDVTHQN